MSSNVEQQSAAPGNLGLLMMVRGLEARARRFAANQRPCNCDNALAGRIINNTDLARELDILKNRARALMARRRPCVCGARGDHSVPAGGSENDQLNRTPSSNSELEYPGASPAFGSGGLPKYSPGSGSISLGSRSGGQADIPRSVPSSDTGNGKEDIQQTKGPSGTSSTGKKGDKAEGDYYMLSESSDDEDGDDDASIDQIEHFDNVLNIDPIKQQVRKDARSIKPPGPDLSNGEYRKYIPAWTDPRVRADGIHPYPYRRPALLPEDRVEGQVSHDPTTYSMRYGKDPAAPQNAPGRSMLTPVTREFMAAAQGDPDPDMPIWLEDWQSYVFSGYTATELKEQRALDPDMDFQEPALEMTEAQIHPIVRRHKWNQYPGEGSSEEDPVLLYSLDGTDRRWDIQQQDDILWNALQPALKLVSLILYSDPPFWRSILDIYKLGPVDSSRIPKQAKERNLTALHLDIDRNRMYPEARQLRDLDFQAAAITEHLLTSYINLSFGNLKDAQTGCTELSVNKAKDLSYGQPRYQIDVGVSPFVVWPLLVPEYSDSEKAVTSTTIAAVILHELAHAAVFATEILITKKRWSTDPALRPFHIDLRRIPEQQMTLLTALGHRICGERQIPYYFFENELEAEEGYQFEKEIWGDLLDIEGRIHSGMTLFEGFPGVVATLQNWPTRIYPRPYYWNEEATKSEEMNDWPLWLTNPPPSIMRRKTAIPVTMLSRYLDQGFWDREVKRYGHHALKISRHQWQGRSLKSNASHLFFDKRDVERAFRSRTVFRWMEQAKWTLRKAREYALAEYMKTLTEGLVESHMMRRRLHYEKKTWRGIDTNLGRLRDALTHTEGLATAILEAYRRRRDLLPLGAADNGRNLEQYLAHIQDLLTRASEINRLLGGEVSYLQFLVLGFLRQEDEGRRRLQRYVDTIFARIQRVLRPAADHIVRIATDFGAECITVVTEYTESCTAQEVDVDPAMTALWTDNIVPAMLQDANANFPSVRQHLDDLTNTIQSARRATRRALADSPLSRGFNLLVEEAGLREIRTERRRLRNLALRDMRRISNNIDLRSIIEQWLTFLESQDLQLGAATAEERQAVRHNVMVALAPLPDVLPGNVAGGSSNAP